jgi:hypothetical protein
MIVSDECLWGLSLVRVTHQALGWEVAGSGSGFQFSLENEVFKPNFFYSWAKRWEYFRDFIAAIAEPNWP